MGLWLQMVNCVQLLSLSVLILITSQGVFGQVKQSPTYEVQQICATVGSTATMSCSYYHHNCQRPSNVYWTKQIGLDDHHKVLGPNFKEYYTEASSYTLQINPVTLLDAGEYRCSVTYCNNKMITGEPGVQLIVTDKSPTMSITPNWSILEGTDVTLTCGSRHSSLTTEYSWYKADGDSTRLPGFTNTYIIRNTTPKDSGKYYCQSTDKCGHKNSDTMSLQVFYPPKNTGVLVTPSGVLPIGGMVTLTCSSNANPPVKSLTWFKVNESTPVGSGEQHSITNIRSENGGQYYCEARNEYGAEKSSPVPITVEGDQNALPLPLIAAILCGVLGLFFVLTLSVLLSNKCKKEVISEARDQQGARDYVNTQQTRNIGNIPTSSSVQSLNTLQPNGNYHTLNPSSITQSFGYQNLNTSTMQPIGNHLNPNNTPQSSGYQRLNPNTMQPNGHYHTLHPINNIPQSFGNQNLNPNNIPQSFGYQNLNPEPIMSPNNIQTSAV